MPGSGTSCTHVPSKAQRTLLTPSVSPSVRPFNRPPTKRPRLRSTPSSVSATPSMSKESTSSEDVNSARRASTLRVLNVWAQLAERYNKRLDEDDIIDLYSGAIIKDCGVVRNANRDYQFGHFAQPDDDQDYPDGDQDDSEEDEDDNEINAPASDATTDDDAPISKKELLRGVPPLSTTTDAEDLKEFMEAEKKRRELAEEEEEEDISPEELSTLREMLEERERRVEAVIAKLAQDVTSTQHSREPKVDVTPTRPSTRPPPSDVESEDELAVWTRDESTAIYPVSRGKPKQDVHEAERDVFELTDSDSDEEFEAILTLPPRSARASPLPISRPQKIEQPLRSPQESGRGRTKSRMCSRPKVKLTEGTPKSRNRGCSPPLPPEVTVTHRMCSPVPNEMESQTSDKEQSDQETVNRTPLAHKGKGKEILPLVADSRWKEPPKSFGVGSRDRKRKRIVSSTVDNHLAQSPEPKINRQGHGKLTSQSSIALSQLDGPTSALDKDVSTPARFEFAPAGPSRSLSSFSASKTWSPHSTYRSIEPETIRPTPYDHNANLTPLSDPLTPVIHSYPQRHPSHPPSVFPSSEQGTPGLSPPAPLLDPAQAHLLLAQAMNQISYLISAAMPCTACPPGHSWHQPPDVVHSNPVPHPPRFHNARPYPTPSSSVPLSSPVLSSVPLSQEERQRARSRARSKSRGRRVSFKLDGEKTVGSWEHDIQPELHRSGQRNHKPPFEDKQDKGKGKAAEEPHDSLQSEDRDSPPQGVSRGRTPGPPSRKKIDVSRGRSLSRR